MATLILIINMINTEYEYIFIFEVQYPMYIHEYFVMQLANDDFAP